eukprot:TRINITY_DN11464_c0_g2_i3.p1 TRINITY_DN11464_c0_g2~~TRINITY_DN11464_c0_g2_i3.p1  ORF type:complete len:104 (+),score=7.61 TRINITY_DN11464_c0_g2_i3:135-446(+)
MEQAIVDENEPFGKPSSPPKNASQAMTMSRAFHNVNASRTNVKESRLDLRLRSSGDEWADFVKRSSLTKPTSGDLRLSHDIGCECPCLLSLVRFQCWICCVDA